MSTKRTCDVNATEACLDAKTRAVLLFVSSGAGDFFCGGELRNAGLGDGLGAVAQRGAIDEFGVPIVAARLGG